jgi:PadR family transcriptional regulator PadR
MTARANAEKPLSLATVAVLKAVADGYRHGFDIMDVAQLPSGTVYPILSRLEEGGFVRSRWERPAIAQKEKRPPRRYYELTEAGTRALRLSIEYYRSVGGLLPVGGRPRPSRARG